DCASDDSASDDTWDGVHRRLPVALRERLLITEIAQGAFVVEEMFRRKFGDPPPRHPHHVVALVRSAAGAFVPIGYTHFHRVGDICLVGGMSTDGRAFAHLDDAARALVRDAGGLAGFLLHYGFAHFGWASAFFGHVGDARARAVDLRAGFRDSGHPYLMVYSPRPLVAQSRQRLIAQAHAIGPF